MSNVIQFPKQIPRSHCCPVCGGYPRRIVLDANALVECARRGCKTRYIRIDRVQSVDEMRRQTGLKP